MPKETTVVATPIGPTTFFATVPKAFIINRVPQFLHVDCPSAANTSIPTALNAQSNTILLRSVNA